MPVRCTDSGETAGASGRSAKLPGTVYFIVILLGFVVGLVVGRWWALVAAIGLGSWIMLNTTVDVVSPWFLAIAYAALAAIGIAVGVGLRKVVARQ